MESTRGVVEVREIDIRIRGTDHLVLRLGDENLMLIVREELTLIGVEVGVHGVHLRSRREGAIAALDANLDIVVLHGDEGERLGPVLAEEEGNHEMIGGTRGILRILLDLRGGNSRRRTSLCLVVEHVVYTLSVERVETADLLTTDVKKELCRARALGEKTRYVGTGRGDTGSLDPDVAEKITLGLDGDGHLRTRSERTDVVDTFGLDGKVRMTLVVLTKKTHFGLAGDVDILGTLGHEVNQSG